MPRPTTIAAALSRAREFGLDRLDAHLLLAHVLARPRTWLLAHGEEALDPVAAAAWEHLLQRRAADEPVAYLVGEREFHGVMLQVDARVLVPRPDTEVLVDWALERLRADGVKPAPAVVDLGTGSGAIAIAIALAAKAAHRQLAMHASDESGDALDVARVNARRHDVPIDFRAGSWWSPWRGLRFDLALANPPYVAEADRHLAALRHEPRRALVAGADGLQALRAIVARASEHLAPGGWLLLEHGWEQAQAVGTLLQAAGFFAVETRLDLAGRPRCTGGLLGTAPHGQAVPD